MKFFIGLLLGIFCLNLSVHGALVQKFDYYDSNNRSKPGLDSVSPIKIIIHGWNSYKAGESNPWTLEIKDNLLKYDRNKPNTMIVNWNSNPLSGSFSEIVNSRLYVTSAQNTRIVGQEIVDELKRNKIKSDRDIHCIGHSLGAHTCGFAAKLAKAQLNITFTRISGLDPAGPTFKDKPAPERLDYDDATFVDIYHTNDGLLGISHNIGDADYYVNGSGNQPGCNINFICSHSRAYLYYIASIKNPTCFTVYLNKDKSKKADAKYGYWTNFKHGEFTAATTNSEPFCKS